MKSWQEYIDAAEEALEKAGRTMQPEADVHLTRAKTYVDMAALVSSQEVGALR